MFACAAEYSDGTFKTASMDILFIGTNTSGYGIDVNGVRYLTLKRGYNGIVQGGEMKVALLSLGQSADWKGGKVYTPNNNAADLGDFYQWGRVADGHQNTVWSKNETDHKNQILPFGTTPDNTSDVIDYNNGGSTPAYDANHQVANSDDHYGKFITSFGPGASYGDNDWYYDGDHDDGLWGIATGYSRNDQGSLGFVWKYTDNNPCPSGWRIPSNWNLWDIISGTGLDTPIQDTDWGSADNNNWQIRDMSSNNTTYGGAIITNSANEKIFLPIIGLRMSNTGIFFPDISAYWVSTYVDNQIYLNNISIAISGAMDRAVGICARCVAEE
jgi:hypothetical protein